MKLETYRILVVDDDLDYADTCAKAIAADGFSVSSVQSADEALKVVGSGDWPHLVITDLKMPGTDGLTLLRKIKSTSSSIEVIIMTGYGTIDSAVQAIKEDATDYITKPFNKEELLNAIKKVHKIWKLQQEIVQLRKLVSDKLQLEGFIFKNTEMAKVYHRISSAAKCACSVIICGESGTGKELIARAIHRNSGRANEAFVPINCSAISSQLIESELFGYRKGAFSGADRDYDGLFVAANRGTLFLDEIAEMQAPTQAKLLRAIQEKSVRPVGSLEERFINIRFVAATNMKIKEALSSGRLREDLYHRLNVIQIEIPPLRKMNDEIPDLLNYFIGAKESQYERTPFTLNAAAMNAIEAYSWPGNIREVENVVDRLYAQCSSDVIGLDDLPSRVKNQSVTEGSSDTQIPSFSDAERDLIIRALRESRGNKSKAAEVLGISRPRLYKKIEQYKISDI